MISYGIHVRSPCRKEIRSEYSAHKSVLGGKKKKEKQDILRWFSVLCSLGLKSPKYEGMIKLFCFHERLFLHHKTEQSNDSSLQVLMADKVVSNCFQL